MNRRRAAVARITSIVSPLTDPEITVDPGVFDMRYGSPVKNDSSITPCPSITSPSTGLISCGKITTASPTAIVSSGTSSICAFSSPMCHRGHAPRQRPQHAGGAAHGIAFNRLAAGEHQYHQGAGQIFAQQYRGDDRNARQQIGAEFAPEQFREQLDDDRHAPQRQGDKQRPLGALRRHAQNKSQYVNTWRSIQSPARRSTDTVWHTAARSNMVLRPTAFFNVEVSLRGPAFFSLHCRRRFHTTGKSTRLKRLSGWLTGLEPVTPRSTIWCSNQLSYSHRRLEQRLYR